MAEWLVSFNSSNGRSDKLVEKTDSNLEFWHFLSWSHVVKEMWTVFYLIMIIFLGIIPVLLDYLLFTPPPPKQQEHALTNYKTSSCLYYNVVIKKIAIQDRNKKKTIWNVLAIRGVQKQVHLQKPLITIIKTDFVSKGN